MKGAKNHSLVNMTMEDPATVDRIWTQKLFKLPFAKWTEEYLRWLDTNYGIDVCITGHPSISTWKNCINTATELNEPINTKKMPLEQKNTTSLATIQTKFANHFKMYTDCSKEAG